MDPEMASAWRRRMAAAPVQRAEGRLDRIVRTIAGRADDRALELRPQARRHHPRADRRRRAAGRTPRSEEHTSELQSLMRISYAVFCLKKKKTNIQIPNTNDKHYIPKYSR